MMQNSALPKCIYSSAALALFLTCCSAPERQGGATSDVAASDPLLVREVGLVSLDILVEETVADIGDILQFTAVGEYDDGRVVDLTTEVLWWSFEPSVADHADYDDCSGAFRMLGAGKTEIRARLDHIEAFESVTLE